MLFLLILLVLMFAALVLQFFIGPIPLLGCRLYLMQMLMLYGAIALPLPGMIVVTLVGGLMWDALTCQMVDGVYQISVGWSAALYMALGAVMAGFRPMFLRGRWEVHCLVSGILIAAMPAAEYVMITVRTEPVALIFDNHVGWRIGGSGLIAMMFSPLFFFVLNYLAVLTGFDPQPERSPTTTKR